MDSRDYDIHLSFITTCSLAAVYNINVNTRKLRPSLHQDTEEGPKNTTPGTSDTDKDIKEEVEKIRDT